jgi:general nucleoside transport system permease protein
MTASANGARSSEGARESFAQRARGPGMALLAGYLVFALLVIAYGQSPRTILGLLFEGTLGSSYGFGQVLFKAAPLLLLSCAFEFARRGGIFNLGLDGQLALGSFAVGVVGTRLAGIPSLMALPAALLLAACGGALSAAVPWIFRQRFGAPEVVTGLLMNRLVEALISYGLGAGLGLPGTVRTADLPVGLRFARLDTWLPALRGSAVSTALLLSVAVLLLLAWLARNLRWFREYALFGMQPKVARTLQLPTKQFIAAAFLVSGAIAGLGSAVSVLGYKGYFEQGLGAGAGFSAIAVSMLGKGRVLPTLLAGLLFGALEQGGLAVNAYVPKELFQVVTAVVIASVAISDGALSRMTRRAA